MRKPTRPLARRIDERQPAPYQQRSPEPVFCNEHERCQGCPYPRHGILLASGRDLFADRYGGKRTEAEVMNDNQSSRTEMGGITLSFRQN